MHSCCLVITKEFPTDSVLSAVLAPYSEDQYYENLQLLPITWDWWSVGGRYGGSLKLKVDRDSDDEYKWRYYEKEPRAGRLFRSSALESMINKKELSWFSMEEYFYAYMGIREGFLYVDGAKVDDLIDFKKTGCFSFIDKDGNALAREYWDSKDFVKVDDFEDKLAKVIANSSGCYACIVDMHD